MEGGLYKPSLLYKPAKACRSCCLYLRNREFPDNTAERCCAFSSNERTNGPSRIFLTQDVTLTALSDNKCNVQCCQH